jgi:hypothetical protein
MWDSELRWQDVMAFAAAQCKLNQLGWMGFGICALSLCIFPNAL